MTMQAALDRNRTRLQVARSFFVQTPLLNPGFGGTGKWTIVLPESRKQFQAAQVDRHRTPPLFNLLLRVSAGELPPGSLPGVGVDQLLTAGILVEGSRPVRQAENYVDLFHEFVTDYPFYDYSLPDWLDDDIRRMRDFKAVEAPPPISTPRFGAPLIPADRPQAEDADQPISLADEVLELIQRTFGPVGSIEGFPVGPWHRKVVPSGGARHPVEAWVEIPRPLEWIPRGLYVYDVPGHCLRETDVNRTELGDPMSGPQPMEVTVHLRARVDRAMWRYRDARSWRAILIDAGHCAQALAVNADLHGWKAEVSTPPRYVDADHNWLEEPWLLTVTLRKGGWPGGSASKALRADALPSDQEDCITQPFIYGTFSAGRMYVHELAAGTPEVAIDELDLAVLTHCMYSRRNDRRSDARSLVEIFGQEAAQRRRRLLEARILWPRPRGMEVIKAVRRWSDKGWYLTALAHAAVRSSGTQAGAALPGSLDLSPEDIAQVARRRRTCRVFDPDYVMPRQVLDQLLGSLDDLLTASPFSTAVFVAPTAVAGVSPYLHRFVRGTLDDLGRPLDREAIRSATIGQSPSGAGAATLWIAVGVDGSDAGSYELRAATLGMAGQRLCTVATHLGLGVFLTPAVKDSETSALIGQDLRCALTYTLTIGTHRSTTTERTEDARG